MNPGAPSSAGITWDKLCRPMLGFLSRFSPHTGHTTPPVIFPKNAMFTHIHYLQPSGRSQTALETMVRGREFAPRLGVASQNLLGRSSHEHRPGRVPRYLCIGDFGHSTSVWGFDAVQRKAAAADCMIDYDVGDHEGHSTRRCSAWQGGQIVPVVMDQLT